MLGDIGNKWAVRILLECILVLQMIKQFRKKMTRGIIIEGAFENDTVWRNY